MPSFERDPFAPDSNAVIWRYMDDNKFTDLLRPFSEHADWNSEAPGTVTRYHQDAGRLWFGYPSSFDDPLEGTHTAISDNPQEYVRRVIDFSKLDEATAGKFRARYLTSDHNKIRDGIVFMAQLCGVSCWSEGDDECRDLWDRFGGYPNGVAVRSTCGRILESLASAHQSQPGSEPAACAVGYVDHSKYFLPEDGFRGILSLIRATFCDEKEIRIVAKSAALAAIPMEISRSLSASVGFKALFTSPNREEVDTELSRIVEDARVALKKREDSGTLGFHLPVRLNGVMSDVVIGPDSENGYEQSVKDQLAQVGLGEVPVRKSRF